MRTLHEILESQLKLASPECLLDSEFDAVEADDMDLPTFDAEECF